MFISRTFSKLFLTLAFGGALTLSLPLNASMLGMWAADGWTLLDADDKVGSLGQVGPGWGGQAFDAEYLFFKKQGHYLSIGVQTGFDLSDGNQWHIDGEQYFAGDLALGFNGGSLDFAIDFGLVTKDIDGIDVGIGSGNQDAAGLYAVSLWNNNITYLESAPFAMDEGGLVTGITGTSGSALLPDGLSYFRTATFDLSALGFDVTSITAHWTMSCGNDVVEGTANVPEPSTLLLLAGGLFGLIGGRRLRARA